MISSSSAMVEPANQTGNSVQASARSLRQLLLRGGLTLGFAVGLERGCNFLANLLAARAAGPQVFGAYSIVLATAGTVATYTGAGIGTTANRFAGEYSRSSPAYRGLLRALIVVSLGSALLAAALMFIGAGPFARVLLRNEGLTSLLRLAAISAGIMILLECCRGLLIGQQKFQALMVLSALAGPGLLFALPNAAHVSAGAMIVGQAAVSLVAVAVCASLARVFGITPLPSSKMEVRSAATTGPGVRGVFTFGLVQLGAVVGLSIAGWWITSLVARSDATLVQMGVYAVANQMRQLVNILPDLLARVCYPLLTKERGGEYGGADHVMIVNTFIITAFSLMMAGLAIAALPWVLHYLYGKSYIAGEMPCALLLATAVVHMSGAPAAQRLNIVNLRVTSIVNLIWTGLLIALGTILVPLDGATGAAGAFLIAHAISLVLVLIALRRAGVLPSRLIGLSAIPLFGALTLGALACARAGDRPQVVVVLTCALAAVTIILLCVLGWFGRNAGLLPQKLDIRSALDVRSLVASLAAGRRSNS